MILQVIEGPETGRRIAPKEGAILTIGCTPEAMEVFSGDLQMSSLHCAVGLRGGALHIMSLADVANTFVNGVGGQSFALKDGDLVTAGGTAFRAIAPPQNPYPAKLRIGGWGLNFIPEGWSILDGVGLVLKTERGFQPNVVAVEDALSEGGTLANYVEAQIDVAKIHFRNAEFEEVQAIHIDGAEEAMMSISRSGAADARPVSQRQLYALSGKTVGVLTMSADNAQAVTQPSTLDSIARGATFHKPRSHE